MRDTASFSGVFGGVETGFNESNEESTCNLLEADIPPESGILTPPPIINPEEAAQPSTSASTLAPTSALTSASSSALTSAPTSSSTSASTSTPAPTSASTSTSSPRTSGKSSKSRSKMFSRKEHGVVDKVYQLQQQVLTGELELQAMKKRKLALQITLLEKSLDSTSEYMDSSSKLLMSMLK
ncbi:putative protein TPRXL [Haliotis rubra]|uniref:putative protein TPRXL n=1 Tax=Haliotis rubra TaxID=36100 RepID=UPI001EE57A78|nr:putative protein TPRXL [Haliotis rubra]